MQLCDNCKKNIANVHVEKVVNNVKTEYNLCTECAQHSEGEVSFEDFFKDLLESMFSVQSQPSSHEKVADESEACKTCGLTYDQFKQTSRFGCKDCYSAFRTQIDSILKNIQGSNKYEGKYPKKSGVQFIYYKQLDNLKMALAKAIEDEEYEQAAILRDEIKTLNESNYSNAEE